MPELKSFEVLDESSLQIILNFKPSEKNDKEASNEILRLKGNVKKIITLLPKHEQEILELRYFQNLSSEQIAQKLGLTKEQVVKLLLDSIKLIKQNLNPQVQKQSNTQEIPNKNMPVNQQAAMVAGFISMLIFLSILVGGFYLLKKLFDSQLPNITHAFSEAGDFVQEKLLDNKFFKQAKGVAVSKVSSFKKEKSETQTQVAKKNNIKISGSTSLLALSHKWENDFSIEYPKYHLSLIPSDSDEGINALIKGEIDIANSSKPVSYFEQKKANELGKELVEHRVALDALVIVINKKNPVEELSLDDLKNIFSGEIESWKPVIREKGSGTNDFVVNRILEGNDFPASILRKKSNQEILDFVSKNKEAIGFINSTNYSWENLNVKYIKIKNYPNSLSVSPFVEETLNEQAIRYGDYPLAHYLYLVTFSDSPKKVENFVDWVLSPKGQEVVRYSGLIPIINEE